MKIIKFFKKICLNGFIFIKNIFNTVYGNKKSAIGMTILLFFLLIAFIGPLIIPYDGVTNPYNKFAAPSKLHILGTDSAGRDVLAMIINGTKDILTISALTGLFTVFIGTFLGMVSGLLGKTVDRIIQMITNLFLTIPSFPVLMLLSAIITIRDNFTFAIILSIWSWPGLCRAVRSQIISLKERDFIQICHVMKMKTSHIIFRELLPNISSYILINFIMIMRSAIVSSVGIMLLGVAEMEPSNWGAMLQDIMNSGALLINSAYAYVISPIVVIVLFQFGIIMLANGLDEKLNPRLVKN